MSERLRTVIVAASVIASVLGGAWSPAVAGGIYKTDGNDTAGPLDLASMRLTPIKDGDRFQIRTFTAFTSGQLNGDDGWIEVDFDKNADRKYDQWVVVYYYKGKLVAVHGTGSTVLGTLPVRRVDKRTVSFDIRHRSIGVDVTSYDFVIYSVWRAAPCAAKDCVDTIPNRYPLIRHDFTAPTVKWLTRYSVTTQEGDNALPFQVAFLVQDDKYGSGLDHWAFQRRDQPDGAWSTLDTGTANKPTLLVPGDQGAHYGLRVIAVDRQGNKGVSKILKMAVPLDDRNVALTYSAGTAVARTEAYLGTLTLLAQADTVSFTFTFGSQDAFCLVTGHPETPGSTASASWSSDGNPTAGSFSENDLTVDTRTTDCGSPGTGTHTITVTGTSAEPFVIDGVVLRGY